MKKVVLILSFVFAIFFANTTYASTGSNNSINETNTVITKENPKTYIIVKDGPVKDLKIDNSDVVYKKIKIKIKVEVGPDGKVKIIVIVTIE